MKKLFLVLGLVGVVSLPALADVDCDTVTVCTLARDDGRCHPAVIFNVLADQTTQGTFSVCDDVACGGTCSDPGAFQFDFVAGVNGVFLTFTDDPPICTMFSSQWVIDNCAATCGDHHCTTPNCPIGAGVTWVEQIVTK